MQGAGILFECIRRAHRVELLFKSSDLLSWNESIGFAIGYKDLCFGKPFLWNYTAFKPAMEAHYTFEI